MHELSIAMSIIDIAADNADREGALKILEVEIELGTLSGVDYESLQFSLEIAAEHSRLDHAKFVINKIQAKAFCKNCKLEYEVENYFTPCPSCKQYANEITTGEQLKVKSIVTE